MLRLAARPPFDWPAAAAFLAPRALPGVEVVMGRAYWRTLALGGERGVVCVEPDAGAPGVLVRATGWTPERAPLAAATERAFDLASSPERVLAHLRQDPLLAPVLAEAPALRLPGAWDPFEMVVRALLGQRVSVRAATTFTGRLVARCGEALEGGVAGLTRLFPSPERVAAAELDGLGITRRSAAALKRIAEAFACGAVDLSGGLEEVVMRLQALPGVGPWTAQYVAMRALGAADAFPAGDLVLRQVVSGLLRRPLERGELEERSERWRPFRAYAVVALWAARANPAR